MELKRFSSSTMKRLKFLRVTTGMTYEDIIEDAVSKYYLNSIEGHTTDSPEVTIEFVLPSHLYEKFIKTVLNLGLNPSELLSCFIDLWCDHECSNSM